MDLFYKSAFAQASGKFLYNDKISVEGALEDVGSIYLGDYLKMYVHPYINSLPNLSPDQAQMISSLVSTIAASYGIEMVTKSKENLINKLVRFSISELGVSMMG